MAKDFNVAPPKTPRLTPMEREAVAAGKAKTVQDPKEMKEVLAGVEGGPALDQLRKGGRVDVSQLLEELAHDSPMPPESGKSEEREAPKPPPIIPLSDTTSPVKFCPRCGWDVNKREIEVTEDDKLNFLRHVLGAPHFEKSYSAFGDTVRFLFHNKRATDMDILLKQLQKDEKKGRISDLVGHTIFTQRYNAALTFKGLEPFDSKVQPTYNYTVDYLLGHPEELATLRKQVRERGLADDIDDDDTVIRVLHGVLVITLSPPVYSAMFQLSRDFDMTVDLLLSRATDKDFWSAASATAH